MPDTTDFDRFWAVYPRKVGKKAALKAWTAVAPAGELVDDILASVVVQAQSAQWRKDRGAFIPHPATWLNGRRWEDELPQSSSTSGSWWRASGLVTLSSMKWFLECPHTPPCANEGACEKKRGEES